MSVVDQFTVAALAALAEKNYSEHFLIGYLGAGLRIAVADHPDDTNLRDCHAMYEAWVAHQVANQGGA